jgi:hypothetical protein
MTIFREGDLEIEFPEGVIPRRFDGEGHKLSECMKAVDCIFEWSGEIYFLEIKDPDNPKAQAKDKAEFLNNLNSGGLNNDLKYKYRDSFLYEYGSGKQYRTIHYLVLIGWESIDGAALLRRTESLSCQIPVKGPDGPWQKPFVASCSVHNIESWKRQLVQFPVRRLSKMPAKANQG